MTLSAPDDQPTPQLQPPATPVRSFNPHRVTLTRELMGAHRANSRDLLAAPVQDEAARAASSARYGASWFYCLAALSVIDSVIALSGRHVAPTFVDLALPQITCGFAAHLGMMGPCFRPGIDLVLAFFLCGFGYLTTRGSRVACITGMVLYALDGAIPASCAAWLPLAFHVFVLSQMFTGWRASLKIARLRAEPPSPARSRDMNAEAPPPEPPPPPPKHPPQPRPRLLARARHWGVELVTVFVGVYAAFMLNNFQAHRQERARREQILAWMEQRFTETVADVEKERDELRKQAAEFNRQLAAGEMPELHAFNFATDYDPADLASVLGGGGFDLLEVKTVRELKDTESTLRVMLAVARHDQQLSDAMILPNLEKDRSFFYNPDTRQLRPAYRWYGEFYKSFLDDYETLLPQTKGLVTQIRAERQRNR